MAYSKFRPRVTEARDDRKAHHFVTDGRVTLFGVHPVEAALLNPRRRIIRVLATENAERRLASVLADRQAAPSRVSPRDLDRLLGSETVHQGIALETELLPEIDLETIIELAIDGGPILVLDQITDPHNVGAVLRSAAVFGAAGVIMPRRHSPPLNGTLAKSASGALELMPIALVQNLAATLQALQRQAVAVIGLDSAAPLSIEKEPFAGPVALVLGAEGKGLRELTRQTCDRLCRIGHSGPLASLNVSNAAAVALHMAVVRRGLMPARSAGPTSTDE